jgi:hypothetical protein
MSESFKKLSPKRYQVQIDEEWVTLSVPYAKVEEVLTIFLENGGIVNFDTGEVGNDLLQLVSGFSKIGDVLLSTYGDDGKLQNFVSCKSLSPIEVMSLFKVALDVIQSFSEAVTTLAPKAAAQEEAHEVAPKKKV